MHRTGFILLIGLSAATATSCSASAEKCGPAWHRSNGPRIDLRELQQVRFPRVETSLIAEVDRCYTPDRPGATLSFAEEWRDKIGNRYLVFQIRGTADVEFAAVVGKSDRIERTGHTTHNW